MRINNVSIKTSSRFVVIMTIITVVMTSLLVCSYVTISATSISIMGYFSWLVSLFQAMMTEMADEPFLPWFLLLTFFGIYICFFLSIISWYNAVVQFNTKLNVRYIEFLPDRIGFFFTQPQHNFVCSYSDIENLNMDIHSTLVRSRNGSHIVFQQLNLTFKVLEKKNYVISSVTAFPMRTIYKIIDYTRGVKSFEYGFSGYGEIPDYREKIDNYLRFAYKDIVGKAGTTSLKGMSLVFFTIAVGQMLIVKDVFSDMHWYSGSIWALWPFALLFIISFVFDIILIIDEIRDNKYRGFDE